MDLESSKVLDLNGISPSDRLKAKTSLRLQYEAQAEVLRRQMGGLLGVQKELGLSARKICQLLLVDPSAWSRWSRDETQIPPHIWRALHWYYALQEKVPGLNASYFLGRDTESIEKTLEKKWEIQEAARDSQMEALSFEKKELTREVEALRQRVVKLGIWNRVLSCIQFLGLALLLGIVIFK